MKLTKEIRKTSRQLFQTSFTDGRLDERKVKSIVDSVIQSKPRNYVNLLKAYQRLVRLEADRRHALVESAVRLDETAEGQIKRDLKSKYGDDLTMDFRTNPELIGGLRVKIGSDVWDGSIRNRLERLRQEFSQV